MKLTDNQKINLLKIIIEEEHYYIGTFHRDIEVYSGINTVIFAATIAAMANIKIPIQYLYVIIGPIIVIINSIVALKVQNRAYRRFLEAITIRAKLEEELEMNKPKLEKEDKKWWQYEALTPTRHENRRNLYDNSNSFVNGELKRGVNQLNTILFYIFIGLGFILIILLLVLSESLNLLST